MIHHDEHGPVDVDLRENGPEWWAMGGEYCKCGHHVDGHLQQHLGTPQYVAGRCLVADCDCLAFRPLDNQ
jgi:hypothetical protein